ncbi:MAG: site-specific integrase, partial [Pseudomonadota bacterium]
MTALSETKRAYRTSGSKAQELSFGAESHDACARWLQMMERERGRSAHTIAAYRRDVSQFLDFLERDIGRQPALGDVGSVTLKQLRGFVASRRRNGVANRSLARSLSALRMFYGWLETEHGITARAVSRLRRPKVPHSVPKPLTHEGAAQVVGVVTSDEAWVQARDTAVLLLLYGAGLRVSEALRLTPEDAPTRLRDVLIVRGKGNKERLVPMVPVIVEAIDAYRSECPHALADDEPMFRGVRGGPLSPRIIQLLMERLRGRLRKPELAT